ncbi:hypothetical protein WN55_07958 [Dufourea novaeangliae]|uniref:Uncharacterized protein n=1 Tax=Dufourea novaeangliae TaxID=178035 RepID=A0A154P4K3_DUFNO|nr:hypothetical protein WN55_07958 [Dufourea novaeangliae]
MTSRQPTIDATAASGSQEHYLSLHTLSALGSSLGWHGSAWPPPRHTVRGFGMDKPKFWVDKHGQIADNHIQLENYGKMFMGNVKNETPVIDKATSPLRQQLPDGTDSESAFARRNLPVNTHSTPEQFSGLACSIFVTPASWSTDDQKPGDSKGDNIVGTVKQNGYQGDCDNYETPSRGIVTYHIEYIENVVHAVDSSSGGCCYIVCVVVARRRSDGGVSYTTRSSLHSRLKEKQFARQECKLSSDESPPRKNTMNYPSESSIRFPDVHRILQMQVDFNGSSIHVLAGLLAEKSIGAKSRLTEGEAEKRGKALYRGKGDFGFAGPCPPIASFTSNTNEWANERTRKKDR